MTIDRILKEYIGSDRVRRITIPGFGALIKRDDGELVFVEMLSIDDGILTEEVARSKSISQDKAASQVLKYAESLIAALDKSGKAKVDGIGSIARIDGQLVFIPEVSAKMHATAKTDRSTDLREPFVPAVTRKTEISEQATPTDKVSGASEQGPPNADKVSDTSGHGTLDADHRADSTEHAVSEQAKTSEVPDKTASDNHGTDTSEHTALKPASVPDYHLQVPKIHIHPHIEKRKQVDLILIVAIIAIAAAIAVLVFGFMVKKQINVIG